MTALESGLRKHLERAVVRAREVAEAGAAATLQTLAVREREAHATMTQAQRDLRTALRARAKNLGEGSRDEGYAPLIEAIAYEGWHRLLFARFLAENGLLMHPLGGRLSVEECAELAPSEGADNGWDLAGRYTAAMLPGIFRADDPAAQVRLAREHRAALEGLVRDLPAEVFTSDDGLGWTYQFWQSRKKDEVNASGVKIGARELAPVTQLFTEDYMVRFLLENSLGAWWAARHPESPLLAEMAYLRFADDGTPAAGTFPGWPQSAAEVTVMDPCCGSGHFLTRAFHLLREMRMEEEGLDAAAAGDAVLRDNLFGLELDERCVQIAAFALALEAWKSGGYRAIPAPQVACSGVPVAGQLEDWLKLAGDDVNLRETLRELYGLFKDAPELGSLINPRELISTKPLLSPSWKQLERILSFSHPATVEGSAVAGAAVSETALAASLAGGRYSLVVTNVPYLKRSSQSGRLSAFLAEDYSDSKADLATAFIERGFRFLNGNGAIAVVAPQNWMFLANYRRLRERWLRSVSQQIIAKLGTGAFETVSGEVVNVALTIASTRKPSIGHRIVSVDTSRAGSTSAKEALLKSGPLLATVQSDQLLRPNAVFSLGGDASNQLLESRAISYSGTQTGDNPRFVVSYWELPLITGGWTKFQSATETKALYGGRENLLLWEDGTGQYMQFLRERLGDGGIRAWLRGTEAWGKQGVAVNTVGHLAATRYTGDIYSSSVAVVMPNTESDLPAIHAFCSSPEFVREVRQTNSKVAVDAKYLARVPFDLEHWKKVAAEQYPNGLPEPHSDDPTQWLFNGHPRGSEAPLQVAVARLLGYHWPEEPEADGLERFADADGIVPLTSVRGETPAAERLRALLAAAYGPEWSPAVQERLLAEVGFAGKDLATWLADGKGFFAQHAKLFHNRPFIWHIWDGARDGFSVLVNSHTLDRPTLERLIYTYLGDWIARQEAARNAGDASAEGRLVKARALKAKLEDILAGEPPYDVYVRWKPLHEQPIGWEPDLNDGVRLNIRPFIEAGVLRAKFSVNWNKDRGDNPPGSTARAYAAEAQQAATNSWDFPSTDGRERFNDLHLTRAVKEAARAAHQAAAAAGGGE